MITCKVPGFVREMTALAILKTPSAYAVLKPMIIATPILVSEHKWSRMTELDANIAATIAKAPSNIYSYGRRLIK
jgi:hypothetical protein